MVPSIELCIPKRYVSVLISASYEFTLFENRDFADVIKLIWGHTGESGILIQCVWYCYKRIGHTETDIQEKCCVTTKAEIDVMCL